MAAATQKGSLIPQCTPVSILKSLRDLATVGLEPGTGPAAMAYLVPFRSDGSWQAQPVIGYRGYISLARRSGIFQDIHATVVHLKDTFDIQLGTDPHVMHKPYIGEGDRGPVIGAYCVARFTTGGMQIEFMTRREIDHIRDKFSKSFAAKGGGPWKDTFESMAVKTVIRKAAKHWPLSMELQQALTMDAGVVTPGGQVVDAAPEYTDSPDDEPEAAADSPPEDAEDLEAAQARALAILGGNAKR